MDFIATGLITALIAGFLGGGHCIGMCGGIVSALSFALPPSQRNPVKIASIMLSYNIGRIASYTLAGFLAGLLGQALVDQLPSLTFFLRWLAVIMLVLMAFYIGRWWQILIKAESAGKFLWRYLEPLSRRLMPVTNPIRALVIGAIWGWLPCGLVYSMLILSLSSGSGFQGSLIMLFFGLGTLPTLFVVGVAARQLTSLMRNNLWRQASALLLLGFAAWQASHLIMRMMSSMPHH